MSRQVSELTHQEAKDRFSSIKSGIDYKFFFHLQKGDSYSGIAHISFQLHNTDHVFLDFCGNTVTNIKVNGAEQNLEGDENYAKVHRDGRIYFPEGSLRNDIQNMVEIQFENNYYTDVRGIHSYVDVDGSQYLQTSTEPYWGNRFVPYFDQPDLKGRFTLKALTPNEWELITSVNSEVRTQFDQYMQCPASNGLFDNAILQKYSSIEGKSEVTFWSFPRSALLPTYLFSVCAGPFAKIPVSDVTLPQALNDALVVPKRDDDGNVIGKILKFKIKMWFLGFRGGYEPFPAHF
jgi:aminopeptidase N